ncbi:unnamed protein product [Diamesa hyperborea]
MIVLVSLNSLPQFHWLDDKVESDTFPIKLCRQDVVISPQSSVLLDFVKRALPKTAIIVQKNSKELEKFLINGANPGVEFDDDLFNKNELPNKLRFSVRISDKNDNWNTDRMWKIGSLYKKSPDENPDYLHCFMFIQNALEQEFIRTKSKANETIIPYVNFRSFPVPKVKTVPFFATILSTIIVWFFLYSCQCIIKNVASERESLMKESLKIMGLPSSIHWLSWFGKSFLFMSFSFTVMISILKISNIFQHSNLFMLWIFGFIYVASSILFCFLVSLIFKKSSVAVTLGSIVHIASMYPYILSKYNFFKFNYALKFFICMWPNSALAIGISSITFKERDAVGLTFGNLFARGIDYQFSVAEIMSAMIVGMLVFIMLVSYIEKAFPGGTGIPEKWYYPISSFVRLIRKRFGKESEHGNEMNQFVEYDNFEDDPLGPKIGICIDKMSKKLGSKSVVSELSLKMFQDQITVLLGANGAGKSTIISMLTGLIAPTSGTAFIDGNDICTDTDNARKSMGICSQQNVLFDELTVVEHFQFFCTLKGMTDSNEIDQEVAKYIQLLGLSSEADKQSHTLSCGMKRKLSIGIALCGKSKVVICDEPTSGMDPAARRELWDLLLLEKKGRTILMTTHFMDEADILGDRIAIISDGKLKTVGSSSFLKKRFGTGYHLVCVKSFHCQPQIILDLLKSFVHDTRMSSNSPTEVTFNIAESHLTLFEKIFKALEDGSNKLGISSFSCNLSTLEEVFLKVESESNDLSNDQEIISTKLKSSIELSTRNQYKGFELLISQIMAIFLKKFHYQRRNLTTMLLLGIFSIIFLVIYIPERSFSNQPEPLDISYSTYDETVTVYENEDNMIETFESSYESLFNGKDKFVKTTQEMSNFILNQYENSFHETKYKYLIGIAQNRYGTTIWYNEQPFHTLPLALNTFNRALLKHYAGSECDVLVTSKPFIESRKKIENMDKTTKIWIKTSNIYDTFILFSVFWPMMFIGFYIKERENRSKLLQMISGVNKIIYWITSYLFDVAVYIGIYSILFAVAYACADDAGNLKEPFLIFTCYNVTVLPFIYLVSHAFSKPETGEILIVFGGYLVPVNQTYLYQLATGLVSMLICIAMEYKIFSKIFKYCSKILRYCSMGVVMLRKMNVDPDVQAEADKMNSSLSIQPTNQIELRNLSKKYDNQVAVNQLSVGVQAAECFGLLGMNGAGKTSVFKMLTGDEYLTAGDALVNNFSIKKNINQVLKKIGYCPQVDALIDDLTGRETLKIFSMLRGISRDNIDLIISNLAEELGFDKHLDKQIKAFSGGSKRKLSTALALLGGPSVFLLDGATTGMDPSAKRQFVNIIDQARDSGRSVILSSHSMEENEALCTRLTIMNHDQEHTTNPKCQRTDCNAISKLCFKGTVFKPFHLPHYRHTSEVISNI